ncbi:MAG: M48 family metallopeptidase [Flavobacteriaceae bacterium]|jgi:predicted Zn-dependent protease|nr:M48 family metallopeptidase [Flavobacteriaceae bacterium]MDG1911456.1 M48 family metallopeptidase [Flavobacteriaceae bacterium]
MNKKIFIELVKSLFLFGGILVLFYFGIQFLSEDKKVRWFASDSEFISYEKEIQLGDLIAEYIIEKDKKKRIQNQLIDSVVWVVSSHLQKELNLTEYDYKIQVIDSPEVNAFTLPGGRIYVNKGLLKFCDSAEQLAAVLAHEMGHVEKRHTISKLVKEFGLKIVFSVLGGDVLLLNELWETVLSSKFDRYQEKEADQFALNLLEKAHISPTAIASFFRKLNRHNLDYNEKIELLMTHPHNNSRIKRSLEYQTQKDFKPKRINIDWKNIKNKF